MCGVHIILVCGRQVSFTQHHYSICFLVNKKKCDIQKRQRTHNQKKNFFPTPSWKIKKKYDRHNKSGCKDVRLSTQSLDKHQGCIPLKSRSARGWGCSSSLAELKDLMIDFFTLHANETMRQKLEECHTTTCDLAKGPSRQRNSQDIEMWQMRTDEWTESKTGAG